MTALRSTLLLATLAGLLVIVALRDGGQPAADSHAATCETAIDLMLVLDGSGSIFASDFTKMKNFAKDLVASFNVSSPGAHIGLVQFSGQDQGILEIGLSSDPTAVNAAIDNMTQIEGYTDIQEAISLGQGETATNARPGVPHAIVLLTDGFQEGAPGDPVAEATNAKAAGTEIFAIGVGGGPNIDQLNAIASDPDSAHVFSVDDFNSLSTVLDQLVQNACPTPTPSSTPTVTPTVTPTITPTAAPTKQPEPGDTDGDGCSDVAENGPDENFGGRRDYLNPYDFFDTPLPAGDPGTGTKSGAIGIQDITGVISKFGTSDGGPPNDQGQSYNSDFDRTPLGPNIWNLGPPSGAVGIQDIVLVIAQFGHDCTAPT